MKGMNGTAAAAIDRFSSSVSTLQFFHDMEELQGCDIQKLSTQISPAARPFPRRGPAWPASG
jgi:hypothetical protein